MTALRMEHLLELFYLLEEQIESDLREPDSKTLDLRSTSVKEASELE